ncbi:armadillo-like helical domain-containing protein 4 isoform X2 [Hyla sarda]|uniref:armadillo-like helical domain-containing protein 4 isoform X2 n=1 Tax=Hyla sarda TaxID=327740 RepID=UPI0024C3418B|nr:armadillo-like helical domain-containing protein 4 isoform X2 [Hyla sarda]
MPMAHCKSRLPMRLAGFLFLGISTVPSTAMKKSLVFHICGMLCSILLLSPNATCLSLQRLVKRNIPEGNGGFDGTVNSYDGNILPPTPSVFEKDTNMSSYVTSSDIAVSEKPQNNSSLLSNNTLDEMSLDVSNPGLITEAGPSGQSKNGLLTTAGSTTDYVPSVASPVEANKENTEESLTQTEESDADLNLSNLENSSQISTLEMLTTNPRTSIVETKLDYSTVSSHLVDQSSTMVNTEIPADPNLTTIVSKSNENAELMVSELGEDWDDTKGTTQSPKYVGRAELTTAGPDHLVQEEGAVAAMFTTSPGITVMSDDKSVFNVTENSHVTEPGVTNSVELTPVINVTMFTPQTNVEVNQSQDFSAENTGIQQLTLDVSENSNVTMTAAIYMNVTSQDTTWEPEVTNEERVTVMDSVTPHMEDETNDGPSPTVKTQASEVPSSDGLNPSSKEEEFPATSVSPVAPMATTEADSTTIISTVTSVSHVSVDIPPTRRITTTASYGLDRLESEDADEEDDDEEDEEDDDETDEDDEEEDDDNKDNDSVDESSERDLDVPLFTLPGLSSQEPLEDDANIALIEGAAYPVPDSMAWEQQNQGLVRSWMEKLKDKAGYMSGMLVPVGVGIAGALFILGVLYSIKIMNRRRRNGFKRHKRKREFNSMQDRVMLLADSSEDEF